MKLNPEDIEVVTFPIDSGSYAGVVTRPIIADPNHPTPATYCFVCD
jgi:hypothetical protein